MINGSLIVVGAAYDDRAGTGSDTGSTVVDAGSAYIFERNLGGADNWGLLKVLGLNFYRDFQHFGAAVAVSGNTVAVGAPGDEVASFAGRGSVFVFERDLGGDNNWGVQPAVLAPDGLAGDAFGSALALEGNLLLVGAPLVDDGADQGAAYLYSRNAGGADNCGVIGLRHLRHAAAESNAGATARMGRARHVRHVFARIRRPAARRDGQAMVRGLRRERHVRRVH